MDKKQEFIAVIDAHKKIIYKIVNSYCKNREDRKDLEQEIIIQLWNSFESFNGEYKFSTWMYRVALNVAISFYRKESKWQSKLSSYEDTSIFSFANEDEDDGSELDQNVKLLQEFINNLNELNKALMLLYLEERNYEEIAEILGISKSNVATKISRIKTKLKEEFQKR